MPLLGRVAALNYKNVGLVCQEKLGHKMCSMLSMFVVGCELCLLLFEVLPFRRG